MPVRTLIFAKAPCAGIAKTRLIPALGAQGAARLAQRMLHHSVNEAIAARIGAVELCATPAIDDSAWAGQSLPRSISCSDQGAGDLGERMARAAQRTLHEGESLLLIGTDCPALDARRLQCAAQALQQVDCVITPTADGGYALLGLNRFHPSLFTEIPWSSNRVAAITLQRLQQLKWSVQTQPTLHDIDHPADLRWLPAQWPSATELQADDMP